MELDDLVLKTFRADKVGNTIIVTPDADGNYKASSAKDVERALTDKYPPEGVFVRMGKGHKWHLIRRGRGGK